MSKTLAHLLTQNGVITFANPNNVDERLTQSPNLTRHNTSGKQVARNTITYTIPKRITTPGCEDACSTARFLQGTSIKLANLVPESEVQRAALVAEWNELSALVADMISNGNIASGFMLASDYSFASVSP